MFLMQQRQLNDKIKYWQYKINQKNKLPSSTLTNKPIINFKSTPEPPIQTKHHVINYSSFQNHQKIFTTTINKLKNILEENKGQYKKKVEKKKVKDKNKSSVRLNDQSKNKKDMQRIVKVQSMVINSKSKLERYNKIINMESRSKSKSLSLSISKSKSKGKLKINKLKQKEVNTKDGSPRKIKKKKEAKKQKPSNLKLWSGDNNTIKFSPISESLLMTHKLAQTEFIDKRNDFIDRVQTSSFKLWEQIQQRQYNRKQKNARVILRYLKGFTKAVKHERKQQKERNKQNYTMMSEKKLINSYKFQRIIKSQESKLLQLKLELNKLKESDNISDGLQLIIRKVNKNIQGLKDIQDGNRQSEQRLLSHKTSQHRFFQVKKQQLENVRQKQQEVQLVRSCDQILNSTEIHKVCQDDISQSLNDFNSPEKSHYNAPKPECNNKRQAIVIVDSLVISNDQSSSKSLNIYQSKDYMSAEIKESFWEESDNLIDSKFINLTLKDNYKQLTSKHYSLQKSQTSFKESLLLQNSYKHFKDFSLINVNIEPHTNQIVLDLNQRNLFTQNIHQQQKEDLQNENHNYQNQFQLCTKFTYSGFFEQQKLNDISRLIFQEMVNEIIQFLSFHQYILEIFINHERNLTFDMKIVQQPLNDTYVAPIQYKNCYLVNLALQLINYAAQNEDFLDRLKRPLGIEPIINLRYIRLNFIQDYFLQPYEMYSEDDYSHEVAEEMETAQNYAYIIQQSLFDLFDKELQLQDNQYQIILNRCLYQVINELLDELRPFGKEGIPPFLFSMQYYQPPSLDFIKRSVTGRLQGILNLSFGVFNQEDIEFCQHKMQIMDYFKGKIKCLAKQVESQFQGQSQYSMQHYQLMRLIQSELFTTEIQQLFTLLSTSNLFQ